MKRLFLPIFVISILSSSCNKSGYNAIESDFYLKFRINGKWVTWTKAIGNLGPDLVDDSKTNLGVTGQSDDSKEILDINVHVNGSKVNTGSYSSDEYFLPLVYASSVTSSLNSYTLGSVEGRDESRYTVTITSITENTITGTFSGNYLESDFQENSAVDITEGEFKVQRLR